MSTNDYAEQNGAFLFYVFEKQWEEQSPDQVTIANMKSVGSKHECGLYLFFLESTTTTKRYPVYIGYTGRTFHDRFYEHATRENGVIYKILVSKVFGSSYRLFVHTHSLSPVTAKVVESIFLQAFNFALNTDENGSLHDLDISKEFKEGASYDDFKITYQNIMSELIKDIPASFHGMELEQSK